MCHVSILPPFRVTTRTTPDIRLASTRAETTRLTIKQNGAVLRTYNYPLAQSGETIRVFPDLSGMVGNVVLEFHFVAAGGSLVQVKEYDYQIIDSGKKSTALIDGAWIEILHWSEEEGKHFNQALKQLSDRDWREQIHAMNRLGIKTAIVQNVFHSDKYPGRHNMTAETYDGLALYPSEIYPARYQLGSYDALEAILSAADEAGMHVLVGVGLFAWFEFTPAALAWHKAVTQELHRKYGHHPSLYGWYISAEAFGALKADRDTVRFFAEYRNFVNKLTPTKPIALAPNNLLFHLHKKAWRKVLPFIDILLPFGFSRWPISTPAQVARICAACDTHFWLDMEVFQADLADGLIPKTCEELIAEIQAYDMVEQICVYEYTGLMNEPSCPYDLGGDPSRRLYAQYQAYYRQVSAELAEADKAGRHPARIGI